MTHKGVQSAIDTLHPVQAGLRGFSGRNLAPSQFVHQFRNGQLIQHRGGKNPPKTVTDPNPKGKVNLCSLRVPEFEALGLRT